jgi:hypothetical protein
MRVAYSDSANGQDYTKQKAWDKELQRYRDVRAQGIEPIGTTHKEIDRSERLAEMVTSMPTD